MKKFLSAILAFTTLLGCFVFSVSAEGEASSITDNLVVAYDFEGNTQAYQLSDKATAGSVNDDLTITGNVTIKNGVATVAADTDAQSSKLNAKNTSDLKALSGYTIYFKVKATGEAVSDHCDIINIPGIAKAHVTGKGATKTEGTTTYVLGGKHNNTFFFHIKILEH